MLVNLNDVLVPARKGKYAVGLFNTVNLELARGVMRLPRNWIPLLSSVQQRYCCPMVP